MNIRERYVVLLSRIFPFKRVEHQILVIVFYLYYICACYPPVKGGFAVFSDIFEPESPGHIEIQYKLGELYLENLELENALMQMTKVKGIQNNYKETDSLIEKINFLIYNNNKSRRGR